MLLVHSVEMIAMEPLTKQPVLALETRSFGERVITLNTPVIKVI